MKENSKKSLVLIIITIAAFMLAIVGATYAYFATTTRIDANIGVNIETAGTSYTFTATGDDSIDMSITAVDMSEANVSTEKLKSGTGSIDVSLASPSNDVITICTYDIIWVWDSSDKYDAQEDSLIFPYKYNKEISGEQYYNSNYSCPDQFIKESDCDYESGNCEFYCSATYNYEFSAVVDNVNETDLSDLEAGTTANSIVLKKGARITSSSTTATEKTHIIEANLYNLPVHQANLYDKKFKAHITIENVNCNMTDITNANSLATYITNDVYNSTANQNNITGETKGAGLYKHTSTLANSAADNSYRYAGSDEEVNNYVCFLEDDCTDEDNLYRIVSVDSSNKTKLIKATSIGNMKWNDKVGYGATGTEADMAMGLTNGSIYTNIWAIQKSDGSYYTSSLNDYLNGEYLTSLGNKASLIETISWSVGGVSYNTFDTKNVYDFMIEELNQSRGIYDAKIGLIYASEYGFAALPQYWENVLGYSNANGYNLISESVWLLTINDPWTISHESSSSSNMFYLVSNSGNVGNFVYKPNAVRPVFSLSSSAKILNATVGGVGTKTNPMIIM